MTIVGFTGTREGMTMAQERRLAKLLRKLKPTQFHHGCCIGADEQAVDTVLDVMGKEGIIVGHPSDLQKYTSDAATVSSHIVKRPLKALVRNRIIVSCIEVLIAAPKEDNEQLRSGTWSTVRYAREVGIPVHIILPDGKVRKG